MSFMGRCHREKDFQCTQSIVLSIAVESLGRRIFSEASASKPLNEGHLPPLGVNGVGECIDRMRPSASTAEPETNRYKHVE